MCGIAGYIDKSRGAADTSRLKRMTDAIAHRGPDDQGCHVWRNVALGHRRLSIVDVSERGHQPMCDVEAEPAAWIIYNGEIYNHRRIREGLSSAEPYRSTSDTEVLLRAMRDRGTECLAELNGIFAFAVLDVRRQAVVLARDQFGIKPLYYAEDDERFYFASEIKAILAAGMRTGADPLAAMDFVYTGWTSDERTMFRNVRRLPPGSFLVYDLKTGTYRTERYYTPRPDWEAGRSFGNVEESWTKGIAERLESAIRGQLMSDVPVGTFCSGGIDSSLVTAMASRHKPGLLAFNVACPDAPEVDEGAYAQRVAAHVGVDLHTVKLDREMFRRALVETVHVTEYPLSFVNTVPLFLLSKLAREQGVKVLLSGEGADETFGGYVSQYRAIAMRQVARSKGALGEAFLTRGLSLATRAGEKVGLARAGGRTAQMHDVLTGGLRNWAVHRDALEAYAQLPDALDRELAAELLTQLQSYLLPILHRTDRASMAASVEARVPFLDQRLVELALAVPPRMKVGAAGLRPVGKKILKRIAEEWLPKSIVYRPKMGFTVPPQYYEGAWPRRWANDGFVVNEFAVRPGDLAQWIAGGPGQSACWMLTLEIWGQLFMQGKSPEALATEFLQG
jgi:asparagine synthase (glutamine-hydrolysing)